MVVVVVMESFIVKKRVGCVLTEVLPRKYLKMLYEGCEYLMDDFAEICDVKNWISL